MSRVLFDKNTPRPVASFLKHHSVTEVEELGWGRRVNGKLLTAAEDAGFQVLLSGDKHMKNQQNMIGRRPSAAMSYF